MWCKCNAESHPSWQFLVWWHNCREFGLSIFLWKEKKVIKPKKWRLKGLNVQKNQCGRLVSNAQSIPKQQNPWWFFDCNKRILRRIKCWKNWKHWEKQTKHCSYFFKASFHWYILIWSEQTAIFIWLEDFLSTLNNDTGLISLNGLSSVNLEMLTTESWLSMEKEVMNEPSFKKKKINHIPARTIMWSNSGMTYICWIFFRLGSGLLLISLAWMEKQWVGKQQKLCKPLDLERHQSHVLR